MVAAVIGCLITYRPLGRPLTILAIAYEPPMRAPRIAPPSLRTPSIDGDALAMLAAMIDREGTRR